MPCTAVLALVLVASLPTASAVTPSLRGSPSTPEGSVGHQNAMSPDEVDRTCKELIRTCLLLQKEGVQIGEKWDKLYATDHFTTILAATNKEGAKKAKLAAVNLFPQVREIRKEVDELRAKLEKCPDDLKYTADNLLEVLQREILLSMNIIGPIIRIGTPSLRGSASTPEGSVGHQNTMSLDECKRTCFALKTQADQTASNWYELHDSDSFKTIRAATDKEDAQNATPAAVHLCPEIRQIRKEVEELCAKLAKLKSCPDILKSTTDNLLKDLQKEIHEYLFIIHEYNWPNNPNWREGLGLKWFG